MELNKDGKTAEETFRVSSTRRSEIFNFEKNQMVQTTSPAEDIIKIREFCIDDREFCYAMLHYGIMIGILMPGQHKSLFDRFRNLFG
jgi:hypothetical protein